MTMTIAHWTPTEKIAEAIRRSRRYLPEDLGNQLDAFLNPENLAIVSATLAIWAGSHFFGVGEVVDVGLLLVGAFMIGWSIEDVVRSLIDFGVTAYRAQTEADLDRAARAFGHAVVVAGVTAVLSLLLRRSARQIQNGRGMSVAQAARPREPGLVDVGVDSQGGKLVRQPTVTGDPKLPAGEGATTPWGDVTYSTAGRAKDQQLARLHELVHSFLSPRLRPLRSFRVRVAMSGYSRSAILRYLEEAPAESFAQLRVNGLQGLMTGLRFPVANGYLTLRQLACEGVEVGTIVLGTERFSVQYLVGEPASAHP
jgi:hypothetical protein